MKLSIVLFLFFLYSCKGRQLTDGKKEEKTFCIIKPNTVSSGDAEDVILMIEKKLKIEKSKKIIFTKNAIYFLYSAIQNKPFFKEEILPAFVNKPIIILLIKGENAISEMRKLIGHKDPLKAEKDTIRNLYGKSLTENAIHCSDNYKNFVREMSFFMPEQITELVNAELNTKNKN